MAVLLVAAAGVTVAPATAGATTSDYSVPGPPSIGTITVDGRTVMVPFAAPDSDGGSPITSYQAMCQSTDGGRSGTRGSTLVSPIALSTLDRGKTYFCDVRARNARGFGPWSAPSAQVVLPRPPDAPSVATATPTVGKITIEYTPPLSDGQSAITGYQAKCTSTDGGATHSSVWSTASSLTVSSLTRGKLYTCTVRAKNALGKGPYSAASSIVTLPDIPGAPTITNAIALVGQIQVNVDAPDNDGGSPITKYRATCTSSDGGATPRSSVWTTTTSPLVKSLTKGKTYSCTAVARNAVGVGPPSAESTSEVVPSIFVVPVINAVSPDHGPLSGGTFVTISGYGLMTTTSVNFPGGPAASYTIVSDTEITAISPPGVPDGGFVTACNPIACSQTENCAHVCVPNYGSYFDDLRPMPQVSASYNDGNIAVSWDALPNGPVFAWDYTVDYTGSDGSSGTVTPASCTYHTASGDILGDCSNVTFAPPTTGGVTYTIIVAGHLDPVGLFPFETEPSAPVTIDT